MANIDSKTLAALARDPAAMARFAATGRLPASRAQAAPSSPLIELLESIGPRLLGRVHGVKVGPELGYLGSRSFHSAAQALMWLRPHHAGASHPAESWRDKRFHAKLTLADLQACSSSMPDELLARIPGIAKEGAASEEPSPAQGKPSP